MNCKTQLNNAQQCMPFSAWLAQYGKTAATGWRWRKRKWISTVNIGGRLYVTADAVEEFRRRAAAGEFSRSPAFGVKPGAKRPGSRRTFSDAHPPAGGDLTPQSS